MKLQGCSLLAVCEKHAAWREEKKSKKVFLGQKRGRPRKWLGLSAVSGKKKT